MKGMRGLPALALLLLSAPCVQADDWDAYSQWWLSHYYSFDPKVFTSISCEVYSPMLEDGTATLLAGHPSLRADKGSFKVSVSNAGHIEISDPPLQLQAVDSTGSVEIPLVSEIVQSKYQTLTGGIHADIMSVLATYTPPDKQTEVIEKFAVGADSTVIERKDPEINGESTLTVHGQDVSVQTDQEMKLGSDVVHAHGLLKQHFDLVDGKYVFAFGEQDAVETTGATQLHVVIRMSVDYQFLSGIRFPKHADFENQRGSDTYGSDDSLDFRDCTVTK